MSRAADGVTRNQDLRRAWGAVLLYTLFVILFGAVVRITGSGAGCGQHWPTCHGEVAHLPKSMETVIELTHRVTSGLSLVLVFVMARWTYRRLSPHHTARRAAKWSCVFMVGEALVGAGIVLLELVGKDDSASRAVVMALHLVNTFVLTFWMSVAWWASDRDGHAVVRAGGGSQSRWAFWGGFALVVVSAAGAVTALGDTLYPVGTSSGALDVSLQMTEAPGHFLRELRGFHPILACVGALVLIAGATRFRGIGKLRSWIIWGVVAQVGCGLLNIVLSAPGWMQVVHLAMANAIWLVWVRVWMIVGSRQRENASG